jgi:hypothetical protein
MKYFWMLFILSLSFTTLAQVEESEALRAMRLSCEKQKVGLGCFHYANMLSRSGKEEDVDKYYEMGCKLEHSPSCKKDKWDLPEAEKKVSEEAPASPSSVASEEEAKPEEATEEAAIAPEAEESTENSGESTDTVE